MNSVTQYIDGATNKLSAAIQNNDCQEVEQLLQNGVNPNIICRSSNSYLRDAVVSGKHENVEKLLEYGADPNTFNIDMSLLHTAMIYACVYDNEAKGMYYHKIVGSLLRYGAKTDVLDDSGETPFGCTANTYGFTGAYKLVFAYAHYLTPTNKKEIKYLLPCFACSKGFLAKVKFLLSLGIDPNATYLGKTALHFAVSSGDINTVKIFIEAGANVNLPNKDGKTPIYSALRLYETLKLLLEKGADPNAGTEENQPLLFSALSGKNIEIVEELLKCGANPNAKHNNKIAIYHILNDKHIKSNLEHSRKKIALLLEYNSDFSQLLDIKDKEFPKLNSEFCSVLYEQVVSPSANLLGVVQQGISDLLLRFFAKAGDSDRVISLVNNAGANINATCKEGRTTALHHAVASNSIQIVQFLLAEGADINAINSTGYTALHYCILTNNSSIADLLLNNSMKTDIEKPNNDKNPLSMASLNHRFVIRALIEKRISTVDKLQDLCRFSIKGRLIENKGKLSTFKQQIHELPLPTMLRNYIYNPL